MITLFGHIYFTKQALILKVIESHESHIIFLPGYSIPCHTLQWRTCMITRINPDFWLLTMATTRTTKILQVNLYDLGLSCLLILQQLIINRCVKMRNLWSGSWGEKEFDNKTFLSVPQNVNWPIIHRYISISGEWEQFLMFTLSLYFGLSYLDEEPF